MIEELLDKPLRWLSDDELLERSHGEVKRAWAINERTGKPERDGLFCARIFGPVEELSCFCGKYQGEEHRGTVCEKCGVVVESTSLRHERFGHIEFAQPLTHPWTEATITRVLVLPPGARDIDPERYDAKLVGVNALYAELVRRNRMVARCIEKEAPTMIMNHELELLQGALDALFGTVPKRPGRGDKLGQRLRRAIAEQRDIARELTSVGAAIPSVTK